MGDGLRLGWERVGVGLEGVHWCHGRAVKST